MTPSFAISLDALSGWRMTLGRRLDDVSRYLADHDMVDAQAAVQLGALGERLASEKLVVAFVAEFSRGKSELINAIFFADTGRRVLPATPGRTTMCPVELAWDGEENAALMLLPIETRLEGLSLAELRTQRRAWTVRPLEISDPERLAESLQEVTRTRWVTRDRARELGFWDDDHPDDNPPVDDAGRVEVPAWRHALINYPHPLLKQGLVVLDTPGLNAIGAEPELTLSLLPSAHATVFILGADTGVTKSDLGVWRDHLGTHAPARFVVLNKIDALRDPLATEQQVDLQIVAQCADTARTLGIDVDRVFPLSARQALAARVAGDDRGLLESRLPALEAALGSQLLPQRREVLEQVVLEGAQQLETHVSRRLGDHRRQLAEQTLELRGLRGKSSGKLRLMLARVDAETAEFEQCTVKLQALRVVHSRMLKDALLGLSSDRLRDEVAAMQAQMHASLLNLGAKKSFVALCGRLRQLLDGAQTRSNEIRDMLGASFSRLNGEFGFSLSMTRSPDLGRFRTELDEIESNYVQYLGLTHALRLSQPRFMEQFRRMLVSKLRVVFENASAELELWNKATSSQVDSQLRERRRNFRRRRESLERVQSAASDLEARIAELEAQDERLQGLARRVHERFDALRDQARAGPVAGNDLISLELPAARAQA
ncbi:dynamin family protein [Rhizobacter sp. Root404]|uniref:dynamin family protein n=1 Tax=Rhizobacter sp. Root404 TaxID=1736528 RepID=UPI0006F5EF7E|nr:dynamin family protein [Rhizobacter sp. Root404]KQW38555.1 dynamin family protein [Rhizobacter sp. Root404]